MAQGFGTEPKGFQGPPWAFRSPPGHFSWFNRLLYRKEPWLSWHERWAAFRAFVGYSRPCSGPPAVPDAIGVHSTGLHTQRSCTFGAPQNSEACKARPPGYIFFHFMVEIPYHERQTANRYNKSILRADLAQTNKGRPYFLSTP